MRTARLPTPSWKPGERRTLTRGMGVAYGDGMWLDAVVTTSDLQQVVAQLTPATVPLGQRGHLFFDSPAEVSLVADRGLRIRCHAKLLWPILGIDVAITIRSMTLLVVPSIEMRDGNRVVVFAPEVDALDLALLPDVGDTELRAFINRELQAKRIELPWNYHETLDHQFALPDWFRGGAIFEIRSNGAAVKVTNEAIGLAIAISASVAMDEQPREARHLDAEPGHRGNRSRALTKASPTTALARRQRRRRRLGLALAVATGFSLGCFAGLKRARA
jgi:hypothetical protein